MENPTIVFNQEDPSSSQSILLDALFCGACLMLVLPMIFGVSMLNAALGPSKNCLYMMLFGPLSLCIAAFEWFSIGSFVVLSNFGNLVVADLTHYFIPTLFISNNSAPVLYLPGLLELAQGWLTTALNVCVLSAAVSCRGRIPSACAFLFLWAILVWHVTNYWISNPNGWARKLGVINAAGGGPNVALGVSALVYSWYIGERKNTNELPHNNVMLYLATCLIWMGWCGIGGTLTSKFNLRALLTIINLNLAGVSGGLTWYTIEYLRIKKASLFAFCVGAIGGFIGVSTSATSINALSAIFMGIFGSLVCNYSTAIATRLKIDDHLNLFAFQTMGNLASLFMASIFTEGPDLFSLQDGYSSPKGVFQKNWMQPLKQLAFGLSCGLWSLFVTYLIMLFVNKALKMRLRVLVEHEQKGLDKTFLGETAYLELAATSSSKSELKEKTLC